MPLVSSVVVFWVLKRTIWKFACSLVQSSERIAWTSPTLLFAWLVSGGVFGPVLPSLKKCPSSSTRLVALIGTDVGHDVMVISACIVLISAGLLLRLIA